MLALSLSLYDSAEGTPSLSVLSSASEASLDVTDTAGFFDVLVATMTIPSSALPAGTESLMRVGFSNFSASRTPPVDGIRESYFYVRHKRPNGGYMEGTVGQSNSYPFNPPWFMKFSCMTASGGDYFGSWASPVELSTSGPLTLQEAAGSIAYLSSGVEVADLGLPPLSASSPGDHIVTVFSICKLAAGTRYPAFIGTLDVYLEGPPEVRPFWTSLVGTKEKP